MKKILCSLSLLFLFATLPLVVKAQVGNPTVTTPRINSVEGEVIYLPGANTASNQGQILQSQFLPGLTKFVIGLTGALSFLFVIIGAIQMLTAFGNDEGLGAGKKTIAWALIGLVISLLSFAIVQVISSIDLDLAQKGDSTEQTVTAPSMTKP